MAKYRAIDAARELADRQMKYQREAFAKLEPSPATKRILKMEGALCKIIKAANGKPSVALLREIQQMAMVGVGLQKSPATEQEAGREHHRSVPSLLNNGLVPEQRVRCVE